MKHLYHLCLSSENELLFRTDEDYHRAFNCFALALYKSNSIGLADAFMSTHLHVCVETADPKYLMFLFRAAYSRYFNRKYCRKGPLAERCFHQLEIVGQFHRLAALSYVLRNPLHHGVSPTPFEYQHSSANCIYAEALGKKIEKDLMSQRHRKRFLPDKAQIPATYKMGSSGLLLRESVLDIAQTEYFYSTPRNYLYYMNRLSGEEWEREQSSESSSPILINTIETGYCNQEYRTMRKHEYGKSDYRRISDITLCTMLDKEILASYGSCSIYQIPLKEREKLANMIWSKYHADKEQLKRCLVL